MGLFSTDSVTLSYANVQQAKQWWINAFGCQEVKVPPEWDPLPSDVALKLPEHPEPTVVLSDMAEVKQAGFEPSSTVPILFTNKLKKAYEQLSSRGVLVGPIQGDGETEYFEIRDTEGNTIEICKEP